jgi:tetratricopeptide (TPR) repeat protein
MIHVIRLGLVFFILGLESGSSQTSPEKPVPAKHSEAFEKGWKEAVEAFNRNDFTTALSKLDEVDKAEPVVSQTLNLRGAVLVRMKKLEEAAVAFQKLADLDTKDPIAVFNLGEVYFLQAKYAESKKQFQKFLATPENTNNALGRYKVFLCDLMLENNSEVQKTVDSLRPTISNPFYYFANAAVAYKKGDKDAGRGFVQSAFGIYAPGLSSAFADSFIALNWLTEEEVGQVGAVDANALKSLSQEFNPNAPQETKSLSGTLDAMLPGLDGNKDKDKKK